MRIPIKHFTGGEIDPQMGDKTRHACRHLENFIPQIYGNVERRPGTKKIYSVTSPITHVPTTSQKVYTSYFVGFYSASSGNIIVKAKTDGTIDTDWGTDGFWGWDVPVPGGAASATTHCYDILQLDDGRMLVVHNTFWIIASSTATGGKIVSMTMLTADGEVDTTWGYEGHYVIAETGAEYPMTVPLKVFECNDGTFVLVGYANFGSTYNYHKLSADGELILARSWGTAPTIIMGVNGACWGDDEHTRIIIVGNEGNYPVGIHNTVAIDVDTLEPDATWGGVIGQIPADGYASVGFIGIDHYKACNIVKLSDGFIVTHYVNSDGYSISKLALDGKSYVTAWGTDGHASIGGNPSYYYGTLGNGLANDGEDFIYTLCNKIGDQTIQYLRKFDADGTVLNTMTFDAPLWTEVYHKVYVIDSYVYLGTIDEEPAYDDLEKWTSDLVYDSSYEIADANYKYVIIPDETTVYYV